MGATATSWTKSATLLHVRTAPAAAGLAELSFTGPVPTSLSRTAPRAPDTMQCAHGYSGCIGVSMKGIHPGSPASPSVLRMAVTGRQKLYVYLASNTAISASSMAMAASASTRALSLGVGRGPDG